MFIHCGGILIFFLVTGTRGSTVPMISFFPSRSLMMLEARQSQPSTPDVWTHGSPGLDQGVVTMTYRRGIVRYQGEMAGIIEEYEGGYRFTNTKRGYVNDTAISRLSFTQSAR
jgi:hypothetical protein